MVDLAAIRKAAEDAGYDCGINGPNMSNCNFRHFATQEQMKAWELGKKRGDAEKAVRAIGERQ